MCWWRRESLSNSLKRTCMMGRCCKSCWVSPYQRRWHQRLGGPKINLSQSCRLCSNSTSQGGGWCHWKLPQLLHLFSSDCLLRREEIQVIPRYLFHGLTGVQAAEMWGRKLVKKFVFVGLSRSHVVQIFGHSKVYFAFESFWPESCFEVLIKSITFGGKKRKREWMTADMCSKCAPLCEWHMRRYTVENLGFCSSLPSLQCVCWCRKHSGEDSG